MEKLIAFFLLGILAVILVAAFSALFALPVMWLVNTLFTPYVLETVFGGPLTFLQAWGLMILCALLFKSTSASAKKE